MHFLRNAMHDCHLEVEFLLEANKRDHDFRLHLDASSSATVAAASKMARACISVISGISDAETAAAMTEHRVELMQRFDACMNLLDASCRSSARGRSSGVFDAAGTHAAADQAERMVAGKPFNDFEDAGEVFALVRQQLGKRGLAVASRLSARIISRMASMRSPSKNMCSVRVRPMP